MKNRNRYVVAALCSLFSLLPLHAEQARTILDKAAATVNHPAGVEAQFLMYSRQFGNTSGSISVKGRKFHAVTPQAIAWFDGTTQWTYMKGNEEVNVSTPTEAELQAVNPYTFINLYKDGFHLSSKKVGKFYEVHLVSKNKSRKIQQMYIIVDQATYRPTHVKMLQNGKWTTIVITHLQQKTLSDDIFKFRQQDFPQAEVIDLR